MAPNKNAPHKTGLSIRLDKELRAAFKEKLDREGREQTEFLVDVIERYVYGPPVAERDWSHDESPKLDP